MRSSINTEAHPSSMSTSCLCCAKHRKFSRINTAIITLALLFAPQSSSLLSSWLVSFIFKVSSRRFILLSVVFFFFFFLKGLLGLGSACEAFCSAVRRAVVLLSSHFVDNQGPPAHGPMQRAPSAIGQGFFFFL